MGVIANLMVKIGSDTSGLTSGFKAAETGSKALLAGVAVVGAGLLAFGVKSVIAAGQLESTTVAFSTMLGSTKKATKLLKELQKFAATTPFEFTEIQGAAKSLLAFGVGAEDITETLRRLGDVSSGVGAPINEIAQLYGKAKTSGRLFAEDINQLTGRGIPIIKELASQFKVSEDQVRKLVEEGKIGFPQLELAFKNMTAQGSQFGGMMDNQSKTLPGMWSNLMDGIGQSSVVVGQELVKAFDLKDVLAGVIGSLGDISALLQSKGLVGALEQIFPEKARVTIVAIAGAIVAGLIPAFVGLAVGIWAAIAPLLPFIAAGAAVAALAYLIYTNWDDIGAFFADLWKNISATTINVWNGIKTFFVSTFNSITGFFVNTWNSIKTTTENVFNGIKLFFVTVWNGIVATVVTIINSFVSGVTNTFNGMKTGLTNICNSIKTFLSAVWSGIVTAVMTIVNPFVLGITNVFNGMKTGLSIIFNGLKTFFSGVWNAIKLIVLGPILLICDLVTGNFGKLKTDAISIFTGLQAAFSQIWSGIKLIFTGAVAAIAGALWVVWNSITITVTAVWNGIKNFFVGLWNSIKSTAINAWNGLKITVSSIMSSTVSGGINIFNGIVNFFRNLPGTLYSLGSSAFNSLKSGITSVLSTIGGAISSGFNSALNFIRNLPSTTYGSGSSMMNNFKNGVSSVMSTIRSVIINGINTATSFIKGLPGLAYTWGKDFINGLKNGIMGAINGIKTAVSNIASSIRGYLHFSTPDEGPLKNYANWMPDFMGGLAKGIESNKYKVANAIKGLSTDMSFTPSFAGVDMTAADNVINNVTITGNTIANDYDVNRIMDLVVKRLKTASV